ncbi:unnamed protein product [Ectocarpus sp. CCAP 1310/34]|nr:unnamed protein product [Ectocarpus sp. CCAP 1310/34]
MHVQGNLVEKKYPNLLTEECKVAKPDKVLKYGTAGFRDRAELLDSTFLRMGMLAVLRSRKTGLAVGLMVTASHNAEPDNGIKMVDPNGGMLSQDWEGYAEMLANTPNGKVSESLAQIYTKEGISLSKPKDGKGAAGKVGEGGGDGENEEFTPVVYVAKDTRPHSPKLAALALLGISLVGGEGLDQGVMTTPMLHHCVRMANGEAGSGPFWGKEEWRGEEGYYKMLASSFADLLASAEDPKKRGGSWFQRAAARQPNPGAVFVDAAHGVGAPKLEALAKVLAEEMPGGRLEVEVRNRVGAGQLNEGCGAEWAQKKGVPPSGVSAANDTGKRLCSFDGDADRLVYHFFDDTGKWVLLDGDKIAALCAAFIHEELAKLGLDKEFSMSVVQTAYANGGSTQYLKAQGVPVAIAKTGVKFVHHEAEKYDVGVYFEANGHGTVLFKDKVLARLVDMQKTSSSDAAMEQSVRRLLSSATLINQAVGDALSDLLFCEAVLRLKGWSCKDWAALYADLPSRQAKTAVADRSIITCSPDETSALRPPGLQAALDKAMATTPNGRCFVRPSGTEDVVRVYAEADTREAADALCLEAMQAVHDIAGGVGERPASV